jgi:hypothetical protein
MGERLRTTAVGRASLQTRLAQSIERREHPKPLAGIVERLG